METLVVNQNRETQLIEIAHTYVKEGLAKGNFEAIPFHEEIKLRDPLSPDGTLVKDKNHAHNTWWQRLPDLIEKCEIVDSEVHENLSSVTVEYKCYFRKPRVKLRIKDRFLIDDEGKIFAQKNLIYGITPNFESKINLD